ncbi:MAG: hypothetical protein ACI9BF_000289 [Candidatus Paceibacteria bacterium]|jgi:hypothetical protein
MHSSDTTLPTTIDEVISSLDQIVNECQNSRNRMGYFPAVYNRVTRRVKQKIITGAFEDNQRMERFDVIFANRYLAAHHAYHKGSPHSESWAVTFNAANKWGPMVIQHLLAAMNAHISLDLGIAAAETEVQDLDSLKNDFDQINDILDSLVDEVEQELREIFRPLHTIDKLTGNVYKSVAHVGIVKSRNIAWSVAQEYSKLQSDSARQAYIQARDQHVALIGKQILWPPVPVRFMTGQFRFLEKGSIGYKVNVLNRHTNELS